MLYSLASVAAGAFTRVGLVDAVEVGTEANLAGAHLRDDGADRSVGAGMGGKQYSTLLLYSTLCYNETVLQLNCSTTNCST
jgi:hypothetical protein